MKVTALEYKAAALRNIDAARELRSSSDVEERYYAASHYLAGLAVECMLRAYARRIDDEFESHHDLRIWFDKGRFDRTVLERDRPDLEANLAIVAKTWNNSCRYYSEDFLARHFKKAELDGKIKGSFVKEITSQTLESAYYLVNTGEVQWSTIRS